MKLIIPMAGHGTRLRPFSFTTPKPLIPTLGISTIERLINMISTHIDSPLTHIICIISPDFGEAAKKTLQKIGALHHIEIIFTIQSQANGTAHALYVAQEHMQGEAIVAFADTLFTMNKKIKTKHINQAVWTKQVEDPSRFGVALINEQGKIKGFIEKPKALISKDAIIGTYYFSQSEIFAHYIKRVIEEDIRGSGGEYFLTDALDMMIKDKYIFDITQVENWWDCGTLDAWLDTSYDLLDFEKERTNKIPQNINQNNNHIISPVYIGKNVICKNCTIGPYAIIEDNSQLENVLLDHTIIGKNTQISNSKLRNSIIGNHCLLDNYQGKGYIGDYSRVSLSN